MTKFIEIEYVASGKAKKTKKILIRRNTILSISFGERKNPVLYYLSHQGIMNAEFDKPRLVYLTQESYQRIKKVLETD